MTPLFPTELRTSQYHEWAPIDPKICPQNSDLVAYVCGNDIYVTHSISGHNKRLTYSHGGKKNDPLSAGVPSYVMQEEFNRYQGYWWQPQALEDGIYRICFEEVDESEVHLFTLSSAHGGEEYRFPRAGCANAKSTLKMIEFKLSETLRVTDVCIKELKTPLGYLFPYLEYIVRIGWTPCAKYIWAQLLNRQQQYLDLILIPVENFCCESYEENEDNASSSEGSPEKHIWKNILDQSTKQIQVIYTERSSHWINIHDLLYFIEIKDDNCVQFLWSSEESGFRHLYMVTSSLEVKPHSSRRNGLRSHTALGTSAKSSSNSGDDALNARIVKKVQLTTGEWEVLSKSLWVDRKHNLIYFMGLAHSPLEKHLYVFNILQPERKRLLTTPGSTYSIEFNEVKLFNISIYYISY
jgi:dipeptidyl-peptidase 9